MLVISFNSVLIIAGISVLVPVMLGLLPRLPVPGAVLEVIAGIVVGPSVLGWARVDAPVEVLSDLGLGMLLFLAGMEIDVDRLRGPLARLAGVAFAVSMVLGLCWAFLFWLAGQAEHPLLLAIILMSTSAGLLLPLLKDTGEEATEYGQLVMTAAALAEIVPIMLLSLFFSATAKTSADQLASLGIFLAVLGAGLHGLRSLNAGPVGRWPGPRAAHTFGQGMVLGEQPAGVTPPRSARRPEVRVRDLDAAEVVAFTEPGNGRSRAVMDRLGMRYARDIIHNGAPFVLYEIGRDTAGVPRSGKPAVMCVLPLAGLAIAHTELRVGQPLKNYRLTAARRRKERSA